MIAKMSQINSKKFFVQKYYFFIYCWYIMINIFYFLRSDKLFDGYDGSYYLSLNKSSKIWSESFFYFSANPLQELGGSFYPFNFKLDFGFLLINTTKNFAFAYLFYFIIYSISIIVLLKTLTSLNNFTFLTALILPILTFWDLKYRFYPITAMVPSWSIFLSIFNFTCAAIFARHISYLLKSLIIWFMFIYVLFLSPTTLLFMVPLVFLICLLDFLMTKKIENVLIIFVITILFFVTGISSYLKGIYENSYTSGFRSELFSDRGDRLGFSTIFWISPNNFILGSLICLIFTSCIIGLRDKNISLRIFCIFILIYYLFTGFLAYFFILTNLLVFLTPFTLNPLSGQYYLYQYHHLYLK